MRTRANQACPNCSAPLLVKEPSGILGTAGADLLAVLLTLPLFALGYWVHFLGYAALLGVLLWRLRLQIKGGRRIECDKCETSERADV
jgi:DNA-directed RNA polymerase subunit RPC12/RpoP